MSCFLCPSSSFTVLPSSIVQFIAYIIDLKYSSGGSSIISICGGTRVDYCSTSGRSRPTGLKVKAVKVHDDDDDDVVSTQK